MERKIAIVDKISEEYISSTGIVVGASGMQGLRNEMEDSHVCCDIPSQPDHLFLAVFDGHIGAKVSEFVSKEIVSFLERTNEWQEYQEGCCLDIQRLEQALVSTFVALDSILREQKLGGGSTAVVCIITPMYIVCANVGDSRCVMGTIDGVKALSMDHKPNNAKEKARIFAAGGYIRLNRVEGNLAMSRALGDFDWKRNVELPLNQQMVICYPDVVIHNRCETDDLVILACDGVWDVMRNNTVVDLVREIFNSGESSMLKIAEEVIDTALYKKSDDNITAVVARLPGAIIGPPEGGGVDARRDERERLKLARQVKLELDYN